MDIIIILIIGICALPLLALLTLAIYLLAGTLKAANQRIIELSQAEKKASPASHAVTASSSSEKAAPRPFSPVDDYPIHIQGGANEWQDLLKIIDLALGDHAGHIFCKMEIIINLVRSLERAVLKPLWGLKAGSQYFTEKYRLAESHLFALWASDCRQVLDDWEKDFPEQRTAALKKGNDNSVALEEIVNGMLTWLENVDSLEEKFHALRSTGHEPVPAEELNQLQSRFDELHWVRERLAARDISWLSDVPRTSFSNLDALQRQVAGLLNLPQNTAVLSHEDLIARRSGKTAPVSDLEVAYTFDTKEGFEYLLLAVTVFNPGRPPVTTLWRLLATLKLEKLEPFVCRVCGAPFEGQSALCADCAADVLEKTHWEAQQKEKAAQTAY